MSEPRDEPHLALLSDVGQVMSILAGSRDVSAFLQRTVESVAQHMRAGVCSIYLYDEPRGELVLRATRGLNQDSVGQVRMRLSEGLVGMALRELRVIHEAHASRNPAYKLFPQAREEAFECFLAVPICRGIERVGVLVVQREENREFSPREIQVMQILTAQLAGAVENARALLALGTPPQPPSRAAGTADGAPRFLAGRAVSPGWALGPAKWVGHRRAEDVLRECAASGGCLPAGDLDDAVTLTVTQLAEMQKQVDQRLPEVAALLFDAHVMMLKDDAFLGEIRRRISDGAAAVCAVAAVARRFVDLFESSPHDYMREKSRDVEDLALRLIRNLRGERGIEKQGVSGAVILATDMLPSDILAIASESAAGVVLGGSGATAHVLLLARSLHVPMVQVAAQELADVEEGTPVLLDGLSGNVQVRPTPAVVERYRKRQRDLDRAEPERLRMRPETRMRDGSRVRLMANINLLSELDLAIDLKAEGVGLYRTEVPFLIRPSLPSEEDQFRVYRRLFERMEGREVTVRTLDAGGDKVLSYFDDAGEMNPALGLRSTRFTLAHPELLDAQLRAMIRASLGICRLRVMFPMIGSLDELRQVRGRLRACLESVRAGTDQRVEDPEVGIMLEVPAAAELVPDLAAEAEFFSIGTNDFVQYLLAVDRTNQHVAGYYCEHHPAVLRALERAASAVRRTGRDLSVCGEMAHEARYIPFLLGIGVRKFSVDAGSLPAVQQAVMACDPVEAEALVQRLMQASTIAEVECLLPPEGSN